MDENSGTSNAALFCGGKLTGRTGVMICGHGGREAGTVREFMALAGEVALRIPQYQVESGFLEFATPAIEDGLEKLRRAGCAKILVIPGTLFSGGHASQDIPSILQNFGAKFPETQIIYGQAFGEDAKLIQAACARARDAIDATPGVIIPEKTAMLVVGRGANDPDVTASMQAVTRMIQNQMKLDHVETAYAGIASPRVPGALAQMAGRSFQRVIVLPYFLFSGMLVKRIYDEVDAMAARHHSVEFIKCAYLNNHPLVIDSFVARIIETHTAGIPVNG